MFKISDHPNGDRHATNLINNYYKEQGDFRDGGIFENVDVANLLNPLKEVYPDVKTISDGDEKPRPVSVSAEKIKDFLSKEWNRREYPVETVAMDAVSATGQTFKEMLVALGYTIPKRSLIDTIANIGDTGIAMTDSPLGSKAWTNIPPIWVLHKMKESITSTQRKSFKAVSDYYFPPADKPQTILGQLALSGGEFALAYATGRSIYQNVAVPIKNLMPRIAAMLETQGGGMAAKEVMGGTLITTPEERLATALQMMGVKSEMVDQIAGSPDDNVFEERLKSFVDSVYTGVGLSL